MNEKLYESLIKENLMISNDNIKLRTAYFELLDVYIKSMQNKCPSNLLMKGRIEWENKIK